MAPARKKTSRKGSDSPNLLDHEEMKKTINTGHAVEIDFPVLNSTIQQTIHFLVDAILNKYSRMDLKECVYSSLKELVINGIKANIKHTIFRENHINPNDEQSLNRGLLLLKSVMIEKNLQELEQKAVENKLKIHVSILHSRERIIVLVENNTPMTELEDRRIREKFDKALQYDSIADYYMNNTDDSEGEGIGITMIVLMLKGHHIDPHAFTIDMKKNNATRAKIEFPIDDPPTLTRQSH